MLRFPSSTSLNTSSSPPPPPSNNNNNFVYTNSNNYDNLNKPNDDTINATTTTTVSSYFNKDDESLSSSSSSSSSSSAENNIEYDNDKLNDNDDKKISTAVQYFNNEKNDLTTAIPMPTLINKLKKKYVLVDKRNFLNRNLKKKRINKKKILKKGNNKINFICSNNDSTSATTPSTTKKTKKNNTKNADDDNNVISNKIKENDFIRHFKRYSNYSCNAMSLILFLNKIFDLQIIPSIPIPESFNYLKTLIPTTNVISSLFSSSNNAYKRSSNLLFKPFTYELINNSTFDFDSIGSFINLNSIFKK